VISCGFWPPGRKRGYLRETPQLSPRIARAFAVGLVRFGDLPGSIWVPERALGR
jgi:hypothetical protein